MEKNQRQNGFTLIELMIVVAVIGVLTAVAVPQYQNYVKKAELGVGLSNIAAIKINIEEYISTKGSFPETTANDPDSFSRLGTIEAFTNGTLKLAKTETTDGTVLFTFNSDSKAPDTKLQLSRETNGQWSCTTNASAAITPTNCTSVQTIQ